MLQQQRLLKQRSKKIQCESLGDKGSIEIYTGLASKLGFIGVVSKEGPVAPPPLLREASCQDCRNGQGQRALES